MFASQTISFWLVASTALHGLRYLPTASGVRLGSDESLLPKYLDKRGTLLAVGRIKRASSQGGLDIVTPS